MGMLVSTLVDEVSEAHRSYVREQAPTTALTSSIDSDDLTFTVSDATQVGKGLLQIDDEMVWAKSVDRTSATVTLEPWGRAQSGSTAASHTSGARVTQSPAYPRTRIRDLLSGVVQEVFPMLFAVTTTNLTPTVAQVNYSLPADTYDVIAVEWQPAGPSLSWLPVGRWRQNRTPTTVELEIMSPVQPGANRVRVMYKKNPPDHLQMTDDLSTLGYPESVRDVVVLGTVARLMAFVEGSRVQTAAVEASARSDAVPPGSALNMSKFVYGLFRQRLDDEARNLQVRYGGRIHFTR